MEHQEALAQARDWLAAIPERQRLVFVLYEVEQMPMSEVASAIGCPVQTAYSRLHKARKLVVAQARRAAAREVSP